MKLNFQIRQVHFNLLAALIWGITAFSYGCSQEAGEKIKGMVYIPAGFFVIGSDDIDEDLLGKEFGSRDGKFFENEKPLRKVNLPGFYIDKYEVTNKDYKLFVAATGRESPPVWEEDVYEPERERHPINAVSWFDANEYCIWAGKRLPTEEEWEKAARGPVGNRYPWGDEFDKNKANLSEGDVVPVGSMPEDKSYYGVHDMGGNLTEWTSSWYKPYPGSTLQSRYYGEIYKVVRGGAGSLEGHYNLGAIYARSSFREYYPSSGKGIDVGFRCAKDGKN